MKDRLSIQLDLDCSSRKEILKDVIVRNRSSYHVQKCVLRSLLNVLDEEEGRFNGLWGQLEALEGRSPNALSDDEIKRIF